MTHLTVNGRVHGHEDKNGHGQPDMPSTIHTVSVPITVAAPKRPFIKGTHDETGCSRSGNGNSSPSIGFLQLHTCLTVGMEWKEALSQEASDPRQWEGVD